MELKKKKIERIILQKKGPYIFEITYIEYGKL